MTMRTDFDEARSFLLRQLSPEETERFEERLLAEDDLVGETEAVEAELLDAFVRGSLSTGERAVVAERFRDRPERIVFAKALAVRARPRPQSTMRWFLPIAASLVVATTAVLLSRRGPEPSPQAAPVPRATLKEPTAPTSAPQPPAPVARELKIAMLTMALAATRDGDETPRLLLARDIDAVALRIRINPADHFAAYVVDLTASDGSSEWTGRALRSASSAELMVEIPAGRLTDGEHQIAVSGVGTDDSREELGYQTLLIHRR